MKPRDRVLCALRLGRPDRVPWVEGEVSPVIARALLGREEYLPEEVNAVLGLDNLLASFLPPIFADYVAQGEQNYVARPLICTRADLDRMVFPDPEDPALYRAAEALVQRNQGRYAVAAKMRLGASPTLLSMGLDHFAYALADDPGLVDTVLGRYADWSIAILARLADLGVDYIWTFDDMAYRAGPMFSPRTLRTVFMPHLRHVADAIHATGLPWIFHSDGDLMALLPDLLTLGFDALHPLEPNCMDIERLKAELGHRLCLVGNIDLHYTLTQGTPAEVEAEVHRRIEVVGQGGGYMISSANSITSYCKVENVRAMADAIHTYGVYT
jgi:uroporphyrinogen-III decarboxylase